MITNDWRLMGIDYETVIDRPRDEVWAWHTRPGAMRRLVPPWQPMTVVEESRSLAEGDAVLGLPAGLRWVARHDPSAYIAGARFADELASRGPASWPARVIGGWRHTHTFSDDGAKTLVHDQIETAIPAAALRATFVYRERQLVDDFAAHRDAAEAGTTPLVIAMTGASGLVGSALRAFLTTGGHRVIKLVRTAARGDDERL